MADLPPTAVEHLYPVLLIFGAALGGVLSLVAGLWVGFKWLKGQIRETAQEIITPVVERVVVVEKAVDAAHRRIDAWLGSRS
jgi:hypothetical protein